MPTPKPQGEKPAADPDIRAGFEEYVRGDGRFKDDLQRLGHGYFYTDINEAWVAWQVAQKHGRKFILIELNPAYRPLIEKRCDYFQGNFLNAEASNHPPQL